MKKSTMQKSSSTRRQTAAAGQGKNISKGNIQESFYHDSEPETIRVWDGQRYVTVGKLTADGVFQKKLKASHILQRPPAIALQAIAVDELARLGCKTIRAEIIGGKTLVTSFVNFQHEGFALNRGFGKQIALPLTKWQNAAAVQPSLFTGGF